MSSEDFLAGAEAPANASHALQALWQDAHGEWERAHVLVQDDSSKEAAWVHAYLHRREGDESNAGYWYARAGKPKPAAGTSLEEEREAITRALMEK